MRALNESGAAVHVVGNVDFASCESLYNATKRADWPRMAQGVALDAVVGAIPVPGDRLDVTFKPILRNARVMDTYLDQSAPG